MIKHILGFAFAVFTFTACQQKQVDLDFYTWRSQPVIETTELNLLDSLHSERIYMHYFDIVKDEKNAVVLEAVVKRPMVENKLIIPVIYIDQSIFKDESDVSRLSEKICSQIELIHGGIPSILQLDCDWTASSQKGYFELCAAIKKQWTHAEIQSTIRLHQIKYSSKTGVPPVDRGVLMYYNMNSVETSREHNSIFHRPTAEAYMEKINAYPLPLDYALPTFGWFVHWRDGHVVNLLQTLTPAHFATDNLFIPQQENRWQCKEGHFHQKFYFQTGDLLVYEKVDPALCSDAAQSLASYLDQKEIRIIFFELNHPQRHAYTARDFETIRRTFY